MVLLMEFTRESALRAWLTGKIEKRPIGDCISRCKRIENGLRINLDDEWKKDNGASVVDLLTYSRDDQNRGAPPPHGIIFQRGADIYNGMASLRSAAVRYFDFCDNNPPSK